MGAAASESGRIRLELDRGLVIAGGSTDDRGFFRFFGLQAGDFEVRFPTDQVAAGDPVACSTGADVHRLVFRGYRLAVQVRQEGASPADPPQVSASKLSLDADARPVERLRGSWSGTGSWYVSVEPGERYLVKAWASGLQYDWTIVDIPAASYETQATLSLYGDFERMSDAAAAGAEAAANPYAGALEVTVVDGDGAKLEGWRATLRAPDGRIPRGSLGDGKSLALPPDAYSLEIALAKSDSLAVLEEPRRSVAIRPGATTRERFQAAVGA